MIHGQQFLDVADTLEHCEGEAWNRTRIGRLYYGVYLEYRQFCEDRLGFVRQNMAREHSAVVQLVSTLSREASENLRELRILRNQADYDLNWSSHEMAENANAAMVIAAALMDQLDTLRTSA